LLAKYKGGRVIYDGKCSDWVDKTVRAHGGVPLLERSGHTFIFTRMTQERALLAGEASGHFFLPGLFPSDALYVCLKLMELLKESNQTLSQLCQPFPPLVSSHDVKLKLSPEQVSALFESLKSRAKEMGGVVSTLDGVRAVFPDGWGIARMSVTEPVLSCRFEASTAKRMIALVAEWTQDQPEIREMIVEKMTQK
jgi:phosphomannomutase/phosphoglucomutase